VPGAAIPGGASGLPRDLPYTSTDLALAVNTCTGILTPVAFQTPDQQARLNQILSVTMLPPSFLLTDLGYATFAMRDLVFDPKKLSGKVGTGNAMVDYGDAMVNTAIARVSPNPGAANRLGNNFTPTGNVGAAKVVALHTSLDGLVLVENLREYGDKLPAAQFVSAVAVETTPTHCGFSAGEFIGAWESLRAWVGGWPKPTAASIQAACMASGLGPCRIDPGFVVPDMDGRIRPR
jgi:hypothetical protein